MAAWVLVAWAVQFVRELNALAPNRDRTSDGSIGDTAHALTVSGHNPDDTEGVRAERSDADTIPEVRAIDVDVDFNLPGLTAAMLVAYLVGRCRAGLETRLIYIIYNGVIWSASSGWQARTYTGSNPHTKHFHLSGHPGGDADGRPFGLASLVKENDMDSVQNARLINVERMVGKLLRGSLGPDPDGKPENAALFHIRSALNTADPALAQYFPDWKPLSPVGLAQLGAMINDLRAEVKAREAREVARDAATTKLLEQVFAAAGNPFTDEQVAQAIDAMRQAAAQAGAAAADRLSAQLAAAARAEADALAAAPSGT